MARLNPKKNKEKISKEENAYRSAAALMEAVDCVRRFDKAVAALRSSAGMFEKLGGYKDSESLKEKCLADAKKAEVDGARKLYDATEKKIDLAKTKGDYLDAIENLSLVKKFSYREDDCERNIDICRSKIKKIEKSAARKRRAAALCVLAALIAAFMMTPLYPLLKGMVFQSIGDEKKALKFYAESGGTLNAEEKMKQCRYMIAQKLDAKGDAKGALKNYRLAQDAYDAAGKAFEIEKKLLKETPKGGVAAWGGEKWIVLEKKNGRALMLEKEAAQKRRFDEDGKNVWRDSSLKKWLNQDALARFSKEEKSAMINQGGAPLGEKSQYLFILSIDELNHYKEFITPANSAYWLRDAAQGGYAWRVENGSPKKISPTDSDTAVRAVFWAAYE